MGKKNHLKKERLSQEKEQNATVAAPARPAWPEWFLARPWAHLLLLLLVVTATYGHTLNYPFIFDDSSSIRENPAIYDLTELGRIWDFASLRVVGYFTLAVNYHLHRYEVVGYHLVNILIHLLAGVAVYFLGRGLMRTPIAVSRFSPAGRQWLPLLAGLLFVLHPLQTQAVTYIVQRLASLTALFYLASLAGYVRFRLGTTTREQWGWAGGAAVMALLALFTKQNAITLPLALALIEIIFFRLPLKRLAQTMLAAGLLFGLVYTLLALGLLETGISLESLDRLTRETTAISRVDYLATQTLVLWTYIRLYFWPAGQHLDWAFPLANGFGSPQVLLALAGHLLLLGFGLLVRKRWPVAAFGIFFYYLAHLVESSLIPIRDVLYEHRTYLPNLGLSLGVGWLLALGFDRWRAGAAVLAAILLIGLGTATWQRNTVWQNPLTLWQDNVDQAPGKARPHNNLGLVYAKEGRTEEAIACFRRALELRPDFADAHSNLGLAYANQGQLRPAVSHYQQALRLAPRAGTYNNLGLIFYSLGDLENAIASYRKALEYKHTEPRVHINLGAALYLQNRLAEAGRHYRTALQYEPGNGEALNNLGIIALSLEKPAEAAALFARALETNPDYAEAHKNLGLVRYLQGQLPEAARSFQTALRLQPEYEEARYYLGLVEGRVKSEK